MRAGLFISLGLLLCLGCRHRKVIEAGIQVAERSEDQTGETPVKEEEPTPQVIEVPITPPEPAIPAPVIPVPEVKPPPVVVPPILIKAGLAYNENCSYAKKIDITDSLIKLSTENFKLQLDPGADDNIQCLIMLDVVIPKGKRLSLFILPQSYFAGLGMIATGQFTELDINILTLAGDNIEASMEYQTIANGPIANDTEFLRAPQLIRRIVPPCQLLETKRTLAIQFLFSLNKGVVTSIPAVQARDLPRIDYAMETCP